MVKEELKKVRTNVFLAENIKEYVNKRSTEMGMSNSAFITMCIALFKQNDEFNVKEALQRIENFKKTGEV